MFTGTKTAEKAEKLAERVKRVYQGIGKVHQVSSMRANTEEDLGWKKSFTTIGGGKSWGKVRCRGLFIITDDVAVCKQYTKQKYNHLALLPLGLRPTLYGAGMFFKPTLAGPLYSVILGL